MHEIRFDKQAIAYLDGLEIKIKKRIFSKIQSSKENPFRFFKHLKGRTDYSLRVGDYRVIADIDSQVISITLIGHRKNIYEK